MDKHTQRGQITPLLLLAALLVSFGLLIPWLGFYWDDWPSIWFLQSLGPSGFVDVFASDRPLLGWLFRLTTPLMGLSSLRWQLFGLFTRWLSSLALWWALRGVWPRRSRQVAWVSLLFAVYPGFLQQHISVTYSHVFLLLALFFTSLGAMLWAIRLPRYAWLLSTLSLLSAGYTMFSAEYFFGLELLRPLFLWMVSGETVEQNRLSSTRRRLTWVFLTWLPYLLLMMGFLFWRINLQPTPRGDVQIFDKLQADPQATLFDLAENVFPDVIESSLLAWGQVLNFSRLQGNSPLFIALDLLVIAAAAGLFITLLLKTQASTPAPPLSATPDRWGLQAVLTGIFALFAGGWPFWATNLPIDLRFPWDRFTLAMMPGASLLLAGLLELVFRKPRHSAIAIGLLIGLAAGFHYQNANLYRREWLSQKAFFWQLAWRAPALQPGTALLASELPFTYFSDNSLTAPLNWMYTPTGSAPSESAPTDGQNPASLPFILIAVESRLGTTLPDLKEELPLKLAYRAVTFTGSTSQVLALYYAPPGCVRLLDPQVDVRLPQKPRLMNEALRISDLSRILAAPAVSAAPPPGIFGPQPAPDWCYYYEKADLARQLKDWQSVAQLADTALALDVRLYEVNAPELVAYIEGYAHTGAWDKALQTTRQAYALTFRMERMLCDTWQRIQDAAPAGPGRDQALQQLNEIIPCP